MDNFSSFSKPRIGISLGYIIISIFFKEKGTTALHVAIKGEQFLQIELLLVYGADPTCPDAHGKTSIDYAK